MTVDRQIAALIVAGGRGARAGQGPSKQYRLLAGRSVMARAMAPFCDHPRITHVQPVIGAEDEAAFMAAAGSLAHHVKQCPPVAGGASRQASVLAGLEALAAQGFSGLVLVHDAARPFVSADLISRAMLAAEETGAAIPVLPLTDTIKRLDAAGCVVDTPPRAELAAVQTPQAFDFASLIDAHRRAAKEAPVEFTDDAAVMEWAGVSVMTFAGERENVKLTLPQDFIAAEARLAQPLTTRVGQGYDVHRFTQGDHVWLGGIRIPHSHGVAAHSDGDVVLHALTDALLGAIADGDIGVHFPPSDPRWRGASSDHFLADAVARVTARGGRIDHLDITVVCEAPKIGPHRDAIRARIAEIAGMDLPQVAIKATTSERMGFTGRGEGLAALALATVSLPREPAS